MTNTKISDGSVSLSKIDPSACSDNEVISRQSGAWSCITISSIRQQKTRNRLVWVNDSSVKLKEVSGETMTVKMNDGNFYDGDASELTFSFGNANGNLGLDTGSEASDTWYYLYAIPNGSTFSIIASTRSPLDGTPGPVGHSTYKYVGSFYNNSTSVITEFTHTGENKILFRSIQWYWNLEDDTDTENNTAIDAFHTSPHIPKTSLMATVTIRIDKQGVSGWSAFIVGGCQVVGSAKWTFDSNDCDVVVTGDRQIWITLDGYGANGRLGIRGYYDNLDL